MSSTYTGTNRNGRTELQHRTRPCGPCIAAIAGSGYVLFHLHTVCVVEKMTVCNNAAAYDLVIWLISPSYKQSIFFYHDIWTPY